MQTKVTLIIWLFISIMVFAPPSFSEVVYEVWGGETDYGSEPHFWEYYNIDQQDYSKLGDSDGHTKYFSGDCSFYVIAARKEFLLDSIQGSDGQYFSHGTLHTGNTLNWENILGAPDNQYATVGYQESGGTFRGFVTIPNPGSWLGVTVITDLEPGPDLIISNTEPNIIIVEPQEIVSISVEVSNLGDGDAVPSDPAYFDVTTYISDTLEVDWDTLGAEAEYAEFAMTSLAANTIHSENLDFTSPQNPGTYYLRSKADDFNSVLESNEDNNWGDITMLIVANCPQYPAMDFNKDCKVNFEDFAIFVQSWLECNLDPPEACWE